MSESKKRLYRSKHDRQLAGVLGGWSEYLGMDPSLMRVGYVILTIVTGFFPGILLYLMMAVIVPSQPKQGEGTA